LSLGHRAISPDRLRRNSTGTNVLGLSSFAPRPFRFRNNDARTSFPCGIAVKSLAAPQNYLARGRFVSPTHCAVNPPRARHRDFPIPVAKIHSLSEAGRALFG